MVNQRDDQPIDDVDDAVIVRSRTEDVREILSTISNINLQHLRRNESYYPVRFLADGITAYRHYFDNAAIFYSGIAIEFGLLIRLHDRIEQSGLRRMPTFNWLIREARRPFGRDIADLADNVRSIRNCYVHYENIVAYDSWINEVHLPEVARRTIDSIGRNTELAQNITELERRSREEYEDQGMPSIRFSNIETNSELMEFMNNRQRECARWQPNIWENKRTSLTREQFENFYGIEAFDALMCINDSYKIIQRLNFI